MPTATGLNSSRSTAAQASIRAAQPDYRQVTQEIREIAGGTLYRVSAWLKTHGLGVDFEPRIFARCAGGSEQVVAQTTSEGRYAYVSREITAPRGADRLTIGLRLKKGAIGTAYFDDLLVEPLN